MARGGFAEPGTLGRVLRILAVVALMVVWIFALGPALAGRGEPSRAGADPPVAAARPIPDEADVFRVHAREWFVDPERAGRPDALPRTLEIYRALRAFPGAPPRIPHGLTEEEFRETRCNTCHERGGFVPRFGVYAPVTPHPEYADCLQCHVANAMTVGLAFPDRLPDALCTQCHVDPDRPPPTFVSLDWPPPAWPETDRRAMPGGPPLIPHDLQLRGNCLACHAGPGAVRELRTTHPERANCRQCHLPAVGEHVFDRPLDDAIVRREEGR